MGSSITSSTPLPMAKDVLLFFSVPILLFIFLLYSNFMIKWSSEKRKRGKMNLPPGMSLGLPFLGETLAYLKPHKATSIGHFMDHHIKRYSEFSLSFQ
jgi:steroid 22-alpha-hydroxylase